MKSVESPVLTIQNKIASTIVYNGAVSDSPSQKKSIPTTQTTWLGRENTDWDHPDNWSNGVPARCNHAFIPETTNKDNFPVMSGSVIVDFTIKVAGKLIIEGTLELRPEGLVQNEGLLEVTNIAALVNEGKIINNGEFINYGIIVNKQLISNGGSFINEGNFDNEASFINLDEFLNNGFVVSDAELINDGSIENFNHIDFQM